MNKINSKKLLIIVLILVLLILGLIYFNSKANPIKTNDTVITSYPTATIENSATTKVFTSQKAKISIELPLEMTMTELPESEASDQSSTGLKGEVIFTFGEYKESMEGEATPAQVVVSYGKPKIFGKGGACVNTNELSGYKLETISNQEVSVCEVGNNFSASYFVNPNEQIEYNIATLNLTSDQVSMVKAAIRESLSFSN
jgi:hypothetical protein